MLIKKEKLLLLATWACRIWSSELTFSYQKYDISNRPGTYCRSTVFPCHEYQNLFSCISFFVLATCYLKVEYNLQLFHFHQNKGVAYFVDTSLFAEYRQKQTNYDIVRSTSSYICTVCIILVAMATKINYGVSQDLSA